MPSTRQSYQSRSRAFAYFQAVAEQGSMRKAASTLNVASSALNRKILDLETDLGVLLFERLPRGVRLTSSGEMLLGHVQRTARDLAVTCGHIEDLRGLRRGHVRVAVIEAAASVVAKLIVASLKSHPHITFDCRVMGSQDVVSAVSGEDYDIGYAFNPPADRFFLPVAECVKSLHAFVARDHPLSTRAALRLSDCSGYPVLYGNTTLGGRQLLDAAADHASLSLRPVVTGNSIGLLKTIATHGQGVCFQLNIDPEDEPGLVPIPLTDQSLRGRLVIGIRRNRQMPSAAAVFLERMKTDLASRAIAEPADRVVRHGAVSTLCKNTDDHDANRCWPEAAVASLNSCDDRGVVARQGELPCQERGARDDAERATAGRPTGHRPDWAAK